MDMLYPIDGVDFRGQDRLMVESDMVEMKVGLVEAGVLVRVCIKRMSLDGPDIQVMEFFPFGTTKEEFRVRMWNALEKATGCFWNLREATGARNCIMMVVDAT